MSNLAALRADAEQIARQLPAFMLNAVAADVMHPGAAKRKRAGSGEQFWQFRHYAQTDAAERIDWRRSARGDDYYVRETELETARTILFWTDPHPGFDWSGDAARETKAYRAKIMMLASASLLAKSGERVGMLGGSRPASLGRHAADRLAEDLVTGSSAPLSPPKTRSIAVISSDFYDPIEDWRKRLMPIAARCKSGVLLAVSDPVEHEFPFTGRTRIARPGTQLARIFGRAESMRDTYLEKLAQHRNDLEELAKTMNWALVTHRTDQRGIEGASALQQALEQFGGRS